MESISDKVGVIRKGMSSFIEADRAFLTEKRESILRNDPKGFLTYYLSNGDAAYVNHFLFNVKKAIKQCSTTKSTSASSSIG